MGLVFTYVYYVWLTAVISAISAVLNLPMTLEVLYVRLLSEVFERTKIEKKAQRPVDNKSGKLPCFRVAPIDCWNFLARYDSERPPLSKWFLFTYLLGFLFRYGILFPVRLVLLAFGFGTLAIGSCLLLFVPMKPETRQWGGKLVSYATFRILSRTGSVYAVFHNPENRPKRGSIACSNHSSPVDCVVLGIDNYYAMVGQTHKGMLGWAQKLLNNIFPHIWFERSVRNDREKVKNWLQQHMKDVHKPPILAFPEAMCVNNTAVINFKRGCFEASDIIYPIVLKYDQKFCDPFWSQDNYIPHLFSIMTSWTLKADVYYLPPQNRQPNESPEEFATRIKRLIANTGGFEDLDVDGLRQQNQMTTDTT